MAILSERLHKLLAQHGLGSRRELEKWMAAGRILLNDKPAQPGDRYKDGDRVVVDGRDVTARLRITSAPKALIYHKPQGQPVAPEPAGEGAPSATRSVMESLPSLRGSRWLAVNTMQTGDSGLLLLTSDGRLADGLRRRAESIPAAYAARVLAPYPEFDFDSLPRVVQYEEEAIEFEKIEAIGGEGANRWFRVDSHRAHRRAAVRALFESRGLKVSRVIQVEFAGLELPRDLPRGRSQALSEQQLAALYELGGLPQPPTAKQIHDERGSHDPRGPRRRVKRRTAREPSQAVKTRADAEQGGARAKRRPTGKRRSVP
ncbi:MAG TPA: S4 domain-containing protein [Steroidobacter sp.]|nr:S4 domain-containing protein [Steroidobacter sp.]